MSDYQIKCGKCNCEYNRKVTAHSDKISVIDNSCPQCGFGTDKARDKFKQSADINEESSVKKQLLFD